MTLKKIFLLLKVERETNFLQRAKEIISKCRRSREWVATVGSVADTEYLMKDLSKVKEMREDEFNKSEDVT